MRGAVAVQVSHVGPSLCFLIDAATYAVAAWCAYHLKVCPSASHACRCLGLKMMWSTCEAPQAS